MHELSHLLGAGGEGNSPDTPHGNCVMSYNEDVDTMKHLWDIATSNDASVTDAMKKDASKALFCSDCKQLMADYLYVTIEEE